MALNAGFKNTGDVEDIELDSREKTNVEDGRYSYEEALDLTGKLFTFDINQ